MFIGAADRCVVGKVMKLFSTDVMKFSRNRHASLAPRWVNFVNWIFSPCKMILLLIWGFSGWFANAAFFLDLYIFIYFVCSTGLCNVSLAWRCWRSAWKCRLLEWKRPRWVRTQQPAVPAMTCHHIMSCSNGRRHETIAQYVLRTPACLYSIVSSAFAVLFP